MNVFGYGKPVSLTYSTFSKPQSVRDLDQLTGHWNAKIRKEKDGNTVNLENKNESGK